MSIEIKDDLPPYVVFETRPVEDRQASIEQGHYVSKDRDFAIITPRGSKDRIERIAEDWLAHITMEANQDRFSKTWVAGYKENYKLWKSGQEIPLHGTALVNWPGLSPAQIKNFQAYRILTVEDIASANEETLSRMGPGSRDIKRRAENWLKASESTGKLAESHSALEEKYEALESRNKVLEQRLSDMALQIQQLNDHQQFQPQPSYQPQADGGQTPDVDFN
jgi:prefoldin subunit 5